MDTLSTDHKKEAVSGHHSFKVSSLSAYDTSARLRLDAFFMASISRKAASFVSR